MNWTQFFRNAGIPDAAAQQYCTSFVKNRIQHSDLASLDKNTLVELGVKAIGDQLAILRQAKKSRTQTSIISSTSSSQGKMNRSRIEAPDSSSFTASDMSLASTHRKGRPPPDSHEIYHIKMPQGTTAKTRQIMQKAQVMQRRGVIPRGTTGVRQGGRSVSPIDKNSVAVQNMRREERGTVRVINQHLGGKNPRIQYAARTLTVTVPERQRNRISFGNQTRTTTRIVGNKPISKVITSSRVMKRVERVGGSHQNVHNRVSYGNNRNAQLVVDDYDDGDEVVYEDELEQDNYMDDGEEYVEYAGNSSRGNVFNRITM